MDEIAVAVAADDRYAQHGAVACASILLQHQRGCPVHVYFLSDNISKEKEAYPSPGKDFLYCYR